jgi:hypothetical protein
MSEDTQAVLGLRVVPGPPFRIGHLLQHPDVLPVPEPREPLARGEPAPEAVLTHAILFAGEVGFGLHVPHLGLGACRVDGRHRATPKSGNDRATSSASRS